MKIILISLLVSILSANSLSAIILANPDEYSQAEREGALNTYNNYLSDEFGIDPTTTTEYDGQPLKGTDEDNSSEGEKSAMSGFYSEDDQGIYINADKQDGENETYIGTDGHEYSHYIDDEADVANSETREDAADRFGEQLADAFSDEIASDYENTSGDNNYLAMLEKDRETGAYDAGNDKAGEQEDVRDRGIPMITIQNPVDELMGDIKKTEQNVNEQAEIF